MVFTYLWTEEGQVSHQPPPGDNAGRCPTAFISPHHSLLSHHILLTFDFKLNILCRLELRSSFGGFGNWFTWRCGRSGVRKARSGHVPGSAKRFRRSGCLFPALHNPKCSSCSDSSLYEAISLLAEKKTSQSSQESYKTLIYINIIVILSPSFLALLIFCPLGTYDVNVEPGKDDVLFDSQFLILSAIEDLFKEVYRESKANDRDDHSWETHPSFPEIPRRKLSLSTSAQFSAACRAFETSLWA